MKLCVFCLVAVENRSKIRGLNVEGWLFSVHFFFFWKRMVSKREIENENLWSIENVFLFSAADRIHLHVFRFTYAADLSSAIIMSA